MGLAPVPLFPLFYIKKEDIKMPLNDIINGAIEKLTQRIEELKSQMGELRTQVGELDTKSTTAYNTSISLADAIKAQAEQLKKLNTQVQDLDDNTSRTTTTPPTADGTGLPGFVILDTKPATEYQNYVYIYPRDQK